VTKKEAEKPFVDFITRWIEEEHKRIKDGLSISGKMGDAISLSRWQFRLEALELFVREADRLAIKTLLIKE
jgi:hypothetical protein